MLLCACVHGVKSEISQVRNFAWQQDWIVTDVMVN